MATTFVHTNLIARDWKKLADFYQEVFGCAPVPPERALAGPWLDRATGIEGSNISGIHLRLPGCGDGGPTLEVFQYTAMPEKPAVAPNTPGFSHIAFHVDDVAAVARAVLDRGGAAVGDLVERDVSGVGRLTFQYLTDPEGNIVEVQNWKRS